MTASRTPFVRRLVALVATIAGALAIAPSFALATTSVYSACTGGEHFPGVTIVQR
jgi:hypothetical protein